jgi:hypothetical protein
MNKLIILETVSEKIAIAYSETVLNALLRAYTVQQGFNNKTHRYEYKPKPSNLRVSIITSELINTNTTFE